MVIGTKIGYVALGSVVKAFCRGGKLKEAACFLQELPADQTSIVMYNTVLAECAKQGRLPCLNCLCHRLQVAEICSRRVCWICNQKGLFETSKSGLTSSECVLNSLWNLSKMNGRTFLLLDTRLEAMLYGSLMYLDLPGKISKS